ncbi:hypothetical protein FRC06_009340, partial [Ceratobasidium sp. 370]
MTDNPGRHESDGDGPPNNPNFRTLRRSRSSPTLNNYIRDSYAPLPSTQPPIPSFDLLRPGSPLESDQHDKRSCTTSHCKVEGQRPNPQTGIDPGLGAERTDLAVYVQADHAHWHRPVINPPTLFYTSQTDGDSTSGHVT